MCPRVIIRKQYDKKFLASLKSLKKGVGSVSVSERYGSRGSGSAPKCNGSPTLVTFGKFVSVPWLFTVLIPSLDCSFSSDRNPKCWWISDEPIPSPWIFANPQCPMMPHAPCPPHWSYRITHRNHLSVMLFSCRLTVLKHSLLPYSFYIPHNLNDCWPFLN